MKRIMTALALMLICFGMLLPAKTDAKSKEFSGRCGENAKWHWDKNGELTITGTGAVTEEGWKTIYKKLDKNYSDPEIYGCGYYGQSEFIKSIVITDGITEIGNYIFNRCGIKKIYIPDSVKRIGKGAFAVCTDLKSVRLPEGLEYIEKNAFRDCVSLKKIVIPSTVTRLGGGAFAGCYTLKTFKNLSNHTYSLERARGKITWRVGKKKVLEVSAGQTAKSTRKKFKIKYVLNGGKLKGKKKTSYQFWEDVKLPKAKKKGFVFLGWSEWGDSEPVLDRTTRGNLKLHAVFKKVSIKKVEKRRIKVSVKPANTRLVVQYDTQKDLDKDGFWSEDNGFNSTTGTYAVDDDGDGEVITKRLKKGKTYYLRWGLDCDVEGSTHWFGKKKIKM